MSSLDGYISNYSANLNTPIDADALELLAFDLRSVPNVGEGLVELIDEGKIIVAAQIAARLQETAVANQLVESLEAGLPLESTIYSILSLGDLHFLPAYDVVATYLGGPHEHQALISLYAIDGQKAAVLLKARLDSDEFVPTFKAILTDVIERDGYDGVVDYLSRLGEDSRMLFEDNLEFCNELAQPSLSDLEVGMISSRLLR